MGDVVPGGLHRRDVHLAVGVVRPLSVWQKSALVAMESLARQGTDVPIAREIAEVTRQSTDGAAYTLRSLVKRGLVELGRHDGDRYGYKLTTEGREELKS